VCAKKRGKDKWYGSTFVRTPTAKQAPLHES
jgi:hypothetical protein